MKQELIVVVMPDGSLQPEWSPTGAYVTQSSELMQAEIFSRFSSAPESWLLFLGCCDRQVALSPSLSFFRAFSGRFIRKLSRTPDLDVLRDRVHIPVRDAELAAALDRVPIMSGAEYISPALLGQIWLDLSLSFSNLIRNHAGSVQSFFRAFSPDIHLVGRVFFHLVENKKGDLPFAFLATYSTRVGDRGRSKHLPLKYALAAYGSNSEKLLALLSTVHVVAEKSTLVAQLLDTGELFHPLAWSPRAALSFLREVPLYEAAGVLCRIPDWWKGRASGARLSIRLGENTPAHVGLNALVNIDARLMIGDLVITKEEAEQLLAASTGLSCLKNKWVAVDPEKLRLTLAAYEQAKEMSDLEGIGILDALRWQLGAEKIPGMVAADDVDVDVSKGRWLESVSEKLRNPELVSSVKPGKGFMARLRAYQQQGVNWLHFLHTLGFGACLADDMGLGKTVQLLAFLSVIKTRNPAGRASLLVIPASLIANWIHEIRKFFPGLDYFVAHPDFQPDRKIREKTGEDLGRLDLVITTYALAQKYAWISDYEWRYIILDEAQAIKNPGTKQTRAIKGLRAQNRIVMTGTPVENRLADLWSLFDFVNPGLLGNQSEFGRFAKGLKKDPDGYRRLRAVVSPCILRRLKTDKSVISDLPDKVEMKTYTPLSKKQVVLYKQLVEDLARTLARVDGIQRRGLVLASIMKCKQLCNHPDQYLGTGGFEEKHSGKFARLREICETIREKREKVLVFSQFKEMCDPLCDFLETVFAREGLVLHGSVAVGKRKRVIARFQSSEYVPFMVLSLKAGGVGLNLTRANHVIHFDRWWNPAVENQATDRAFRIGQKKKVVVHKFLTRGTIEEKIDDMLAEKRALSDRIISETGEAWITEMDNDALVNLFTLTL